MNPESRKLIQVSIEDLETTEECFSMCMGNDIDLRKAFIVENAEYFTENCI